MTILLVLLVVLPWSVWRQTRVHELTRSGLVKLPLIFFAVALLGGVTRDLPTDGEALAYVAVSAAVSIGFGVWRAVVMPVWEGDDGRPMTQGNRLTITLWTALIVIKVAMASVASATGIFPGEHAAEIFLFIAVSFAAQNVLLDRRLVAFRSRQSREAAGPAVERQAAERHQE